MDSAECQERVFLFNHEVGRFYFASSYIGPTHHLIVLAEHQIALSASLFGEQCDVGAVSLVIGYHFGKIEVGEYIGIVHQERFVAFEQMSRFQYAAASVEQKVAFVANGDIDAEIILIFKEIDYLVAEVVHVDHHIGNATALYVGDYALQHSHAAEFHERFRLVVGERAQTSAQACCKD